MANFRYYKNKGKRYPRRTSIDGQLDKPGLVYWSANCACDYILESLKLPQTLPIESTLPVIIESARKEWRKISKEARDIGSEVHAAIAVWLKTGKEPKDPSPEVLSGFVAFLEWIETWKSVKTLETEKTVYADRWAGTYDWLVRLDGEVWLIDFKSSKEPKNKKPYEEWRTQLAGYRSQEPRAEHHAVLRLDKLTGFPDFYDLSEHYEQDLKVSNCLVDLWYLRHASFKQEI